MIIKKKKIIETISLKEKNPYIDNKAKNDLNNIKNFLQEVGFYFSSVDVLKKDNSNNTIDLIYNIDLGKKAYIGEIVFLGDKKFKKRKLLNVITSEEDKFWKFISSKRLLNKQRLELDQRLLLNFYKDKGYYKASVLNNSVQFDNTDKFNVSSSTGNTSIAGSLGVTGATTLTGALTANGGITTTDITATGTSTL